MGRVPENPRDKRHLSPFALTIVADKRTAWFAWLYFGAKRALRTFLKSIGGWLTTAFDLLQKVKRLDPHCAYIGGACFDPDQVIQLNLHVTYYTSFGFVNVFLLKNVYKTNWGSFRTILNWNKILLIIPGLATHTSFISNMISSNRNVDPCFHSLKSEKTNKKNLDQWLCCKSG